MAIEARRACGYRRVGGTYLCGGDTPSFCDRLPYPLAACPAWGDGVRVFGEFGSINPPKLFDSHHFGDQDDKSGLYIRSCTDGALTCFMCDSRDEPTFIMGGGEKFYKTTAEFVSGAREPGVYKRIPFIPKDSKLSDTVVSLAHPKAVAIKEPVVLYHARSTLEESETKQPRLLEIEKVEKRLGILFATTSKMPAKTCA
jgi:hypothetical protein